MKQITFSTFLRKYPNENACLDEIFRRKYPNGRAYCTHCKKETAHFKHKTYKAYSCTYCRKQISPLAGTVFEHSSVDLRLWFYAMFLMTSTRGGISAKQLERELGVCYKTAHRMMKMIRKSMNESGGNKLKGTVEVDESFFGGKGYNRRYIPDFNSKPKDIIMGMVEREGKVVMKKIDTTGRLELMEQIEKHIDRNATVMHDQYPGYQNLHRLGYDHHAVNHGKTYVRGKVYTNNIEGLWGRIKPGIKGVYRKVTSKYIESYMDEYCFRYNHRKEPELMFDLLLSRTITL